MKKNGKRTKHLTNDTATNHRELPEVYAGG